MQRAPANPVEGIGLILGVDRFLDMCRTTLNVTGNLAAAVVVGRGEPAYNDSSIRSGCPAIHARSASRISRRSPTWPVRMRYSSAGVTSP